MEKEGGELCRREEKGGANEYGLETDEKGRRRRMMDKAGGGRKRKEEGGGERKMYV